jgi:glycosyltransferase involved in cell wall biosynthesis
MNKPKISVIMLTYNRENLVGRMMDCILEQSFRDFEFIVVDNGSTDGSGKIADEYAQKDGRVKVIHRSGGNIGSGRNAGLDAARGEYAAFVDDDDTCTSDYLRFLYELAVENGADASICGATWAEYDEKRVMSPEEATETLLWRKRYNVAFPTKLFKRGLFDDNRFLETGKYDDIYLMPILLASANKVAYHGLSKYHFNRHEGNNSAWTQNHKLLDAETLTEYLRVYRERTDRLCASFPNGADKWRYFEWSFWVSMVEKVTRLGLADCGALAEELRWRLAAFREEFAGSAYILDFEKEWLARYVPEMGAI